MRRRVVAAAVALCAATALAPAAGAQSVLPPSLKADTAFAPPSGIARHDFQTGTAPDTATSTAVSGDRIYTVGETSSSGDANVGIIARRTDGSFDTGFSGDGKLVLPIAVSTNRDTASGVAVLPDGRLRIVGATDVVAATSGNDSVNLDVLVIGLKPDGSFDTTFGGGDGIVIFPAGSKDDGAKRLALDGGGRIAITGAASDGTRDDTFVALLNADGSPATFGVNGVRIIDRGGGLFNDRGIDIAFRPGGGLLAFLQVETTPDGNANDWVGVLRAYTETGADDTRFSENGDFVVPAGTPDPASGGLIAFGDRLWLASAAKVGADVDAYVARINADGADFQLRRFDMRGGAVDPDQAVTSQALDLDMLPGAPDTLVVVGSLTSDLGTDWAAAAFNTLDGPLDKAGFVDLVIPTPGQGALVGVATGASGWVATAGSLLDTSTLDSGFGTARLLVDADKRCDLAIEVVEPLEILMPSGVGTRVTLKVTNNGTKACAGTVGANAPFQLAGATAPLETGVILPGGSVLLEKLLLTYGGYRERDDIVTFTVTTAADENPADNTRNARVYFQFCDLQLRAVGTTGLLPTEGGRRVEFSIRNVGTVTCRKVRLAVAAPGRANTLQESITLRAGRSATDEMRLSIPGGKAGARVPVVVRTRAESDPNPANDSVRLTPRVLRVGDTDIRRVTGRTVHGRATPGRGVLSKKQLRVARVQVAAFRRAGKLCRWLTKSGRLARRSCNRPVWLGARGRSTWRATLPTGLSGRSTVISRAVLAAGYPEASFTTKDRNRRSFTAR